MIDHPAPDLGVILFLGLLSFIVLVIGWKRDFFSFPQEMLNWSLPIRFFHVISIFLIYFFSFFYLTPLIGTFIKRSFLSPSTPDVLLKYASWLHMIGSTLTFLLIALFFFYLPSQIRKKIWVREENNHDYKMDIRSALFAWILSFPLVLFLSQFLNFIVTEIFHIKEIPEQLAVYFLKMTFSHPLFFVFAVLTIVVFAPLIEELLFRGFLQSFIRQHLGNKQAIGITSLLFSFFHYSPEQGIGNLPIIASLFVLSLFIGFIYEKRGSLAAPISLHAMFNAINVINLYFLGGISNTPL